VSSFNLNGGSASIAYNAKSWLGGVADFGGYSNGYLEYWNQWNALDVPLLVRVFPYRHFGRITPFGEVLFGVAHASSAGTSGSDNAFAMTLAAVSITNERSLCDSSVKVDYLNDAIFRNRYE